MEDGFGRQRESRASGDNRSNRCVTRVFVRVTLNYSGAGRLQQGRLIDFTSKHSGGIT